jgi:hypothetical protein
VSRRHSENTQKVNKKKKMANFKMNKKSSTKLLSSLLTTSGIESFYQVKILGASAFFQIVLVKSSTIRVKKFEINQPI